MSKWAPDEILELAEQCERLTGEDHNMDQDIDHMMWGPSCSRTLPYTKSMDAAAKLVPPGLSFELRCSGSGDKGQATVWDPMHVPGAREWRVTGRANPALALCVAALKARAARAIETAQPPRRGTGSARKGESASA